MLPVPQAAAMVMACVALSGTVACGRGDTPQNTASDPPANAQAVPESLPMGGKKSVTRFFVTSRGVGRGGNLGGLAGADAHCQTLAAAEGAGDHAWRAYLSVSTSADGPAVNARDRIGRGPWYNAEGLLIAANVEELHSDQARINKKTALTERLDQVNGVGETPNIHDILTGSRPDGTAYPPEDNLTCDNWTSDASDRRAQVGHHDRRGLAEGVNSWNSVHASRGCSEADLEATGGAGLLYCFAID
jgi:hypothetical protein